MPCNVYAKNKIYWTALCPPYLATLSENDFHAFIHQGAGKRGTLNELEDSRFVTHHAHTAPWSEARVNLAQSRITIHVYLNFKKNDLNIKDYNNLKHLASRGINQFWSRSIKVSNHSFVVTVNVVHRTVHAIEVDLYVEQ